MAGRRGGLPCLGALQTSLTVACPQGWDGDSREMQIRRRARMRRINRETGPMGFVALHLFCVQSLRIEVPLRLQIEPHFMPSLVVVSESSRRSGALCGKREQNPFGP